MEIIDTHTHIFPKKQAKEIILKINSNIETFSDGTLIGLIKNMKKYKINYSLTLPIATKASQVQSINNWILNNQHNKIVSFGAIHPDYEKIEDELSKIKKNGLPGIKLHPDYQGFYPTEARLYKIYEICNKLNLIITFHCGDDTGHPFPGHALPRLIRKVVDDFPNLTIIASHFGGFDMWDQSMKYLIGKNIYIETSCTLGYMEKKQFLRIINKHDKNRILLGSDSPWGNIKQNVQGILNSPLRAQTKEKILSLNAKKLLNIF